MHNPCEQLSDMLVNKRVILIQNYRDKFKARNRATAHVWEEWCYYSCQKYFKEKVWRQFFYEIRNSSKLGLYNCIKEKLIVTERYLSEISYYKYRSAFAKFRISVYTFPIEKGRLSFISSSKRYCPLCVGNHIGDEKHYILHCTNINFIEPRKSFLTKLYRINTNNSLINSSPKDVTQWVLSGKLVKEMSETGKFLHLILELAEKLLREADTGP